MATSMTMTGQSTMTIDLEASGFTAEQVTRLIELRKRSSPFREQFSEREFQQLSFLRWQIQRGLARTGHGRE